MKPRFQQTLVLPIAPQRWAPPTAPVTLDGITLAPKRELHITLIGSALGRELRSVLDAAHVEAAVAAEFDALDWSFHRLREHRLLRKPLPGGRLAHSLIELVDLPAMVPFHEALGRLLGRELPVPPAHVTLYVAGRDKGIGVATHAQLRQLCVRDVALRPD